MPVAGSKAIVLAVDESLAKKAALLLAAALVAFIALGAPARADDYPERAACEKALVAITAQADTCTDELSQVNKPNVGCETKSKSAHVFAKLASCQAKIAQR